MVKRFLLVGGLVMAVQAMPAVADTAVIDDSREVSGGGSASLPSSLQCVPYARQVTGIQIYGDAHTWWDQAAGRYARGTQPRVGAVMAFKPHGNSTLGHVAAVSKIVDSRTVLVRHANWSLINGRRGQIEDNVKVVDVSPTNDWSEVRVWYAPIGALGGSHWPLEGFIYKAKPRAGDSLALRQPRPGPTVADALPSGRNSDPIGELIKARLRF